MMLLLSIILFASAEEKNIIYQRHTEIDFDAIELTGELIKPQGSLIIERQGTKFNPLIQLRWDWNEEMIQSVKTIQ